jgi:hypothetical protein
MCLSRRPGERRDPYAAAVIFAEGIQHQRPHRKAAAYRSRLKAGTTGIYHFDLAARCARVLLFSSALGNQRAQGRPGARCTRGLVCNLHKEMRTRAYRFSGNTPAFPAQWFYGLYRALLGDRLVCHRRLAGLDPQDLTPASGRQNHTTSPSASRTVRQRRIRVHRIPPRVS